MQKRMLVGKARQSIRGKFSTTADMQLWNLLNSNIFGHKRHVPSWASQRQCQVAPFYSLAEISGRYPEK